VAAVTELPAPSAHGSTSLTAIEQRGKAALRFLSSDRTTSPEFRSILSEIAR
jgi:hypothetical protein